MRVSRSYQVEGVQAIFNYFATKSGNPVAVFPGGTGKSTVMADFMREAITKYPSTTFICATQFSELVEQNYLEMLEVWKDAPAGMVSATFDKKQFGRQITFAGIQSVYKHADKFPPIDILVIDEGQSVPKSGEGMWRSFIADLKRYNPKLKVVMLTATDYRLDSGMIHQGEGRIATDVCYEYKITEAIKEGYLCEVLTPQTETHLTTHRVHKRGGEFIPGELERAVDIETTTQKCVAEMVKYGTEQNRRSWLVFAAGVDHAEHIRDAVRKHGIECEVISDRTPKSERRSIIKRFKSYALRCLVNVTIATVGFNHRGVDLIGDAAPTNSPGRHVQKLCRGTRTVIAEYFTREERLAAILASVKPNCLVLDWAGNVARHGPLDQIYVKEKHGKGDGEAPQKICEACHAYCHASARICPECGKEFEFKTIDDKLTATASNAPILSTQAVSAWLDIKRWSMMPHEKVGKPICMQVSYNTVINSQREWVLFEHSGFPRDKAVRWWAQHGGAIPPPITTMEAISRVGELTMPKQIAVKKNGKYTEIVDRRL